MSGSENDSGPAGMVLMVGVLDTVLVALALWAFSVGASGPGAGILTLACVLTGIDLWLYRRGSF